MISSAQLESHCYENISKLVGTIQRSDTTQKESHKPESELEVLEDFDWYHGDLTKEEAEAILHSDDSNGFFVYESTHTLVLSTRLNGWKAHSIISYSQKGYHLEGKKKFFKTIPKMVAHYQHSPFSGKHVLGAAIGKHTTTGELKYKISSRGV